MMKRTDLSDLPTNVKEKNAEITEVENGFLLEVTYIDKTSGFENKKFIYVDWDEMVSELGAWFTDNGPDVQD